MYSLRHTSRLSGALLEKKRSTLRAMGHARSRLVHEVDAHALPSGMASVSERVTARALGKRTKLMIIEGRKRDVRRSLDDTSKSAEKKAIST
jgi:hypothetical protein